MPLWEEVYKFVNPTRLFYGPKDKSKAKKPETPFTSRGIQACKTAAAGFQGYTATRQTQWFKLVLRDELMELPGVGKWLERCENILITEFNASNFYEALGEINPDTHAIGTGYIYSEEDIGRSRMIYQCRHPKACWIAENAFGEVDTLHEEVYLSYKAAEERFGDRLPDKRKEAGKKNPYDTFTILHIVIPKDDRYFDLGLFQGDKRMPYLSIWYDREEKKIVDIGGYWEFPYAVSRYMKNAGEVYGRSPGQDALGDILGANQMKKSRIRLGQLVAEPHLQVPERLQGDDRIIPGGRTYIPANERGRIEPVQIGANYPITIDNENRQDEIINEHFNVQIYMMLQQAQGQMTAREVTERMGEKAAILGYVTGRYTTEVLQPLIKRTFNVLFRAGRLPEPPQAILSLQEPAGLDIQFLGFMSQIQKRYYATNGINASIEYIGALGQMFPDTLDNVDSDALIREALESGGAPAAILRDQDQVAALRQQKAAMQQAMMQQQQEQSIMQNMDKLNQPVQPGSPLEAMGQAAAQGQI